MGNSQANKPDSKIYDPDYFQSKTKSNESNFLCCLPKEILYYCVPLSMDLKFVGGKRLNWREAKKAQSFTKKDFQLGTLERMEEIVGEPGMRHITDTIKKDDSASSSEGMPALIGSSLSQSLDETEATEDPMQNLPFHNKYYFALDDARNLMATCHAIRKKLLPFFKW
jgi:hypothetical protein